MTPHPGMMMMDPAARPGNMVPFQNSLCVTILVIIDTVPFI